MLYSSADEWRNTAHKRVLFFGMSGLGKTYISNILRGAGSWFHYSIDYRIGTRYMGEYITDNAKAEAMKVPFLRDLLLSDSIYIGSNISFENLTPVASYLGKPGAPSKSGLEMAEYTRRQDQFRTAELNALRDTNYFIDRAQRLYDYPNFICDTGGSICEWVDANDPNDPLLKQLSDETLMVWIKGDEAHTQELIRRFDRAPKPMAYEPAFLARVWQEYLKENNLSETDVDPDSFIRWTYAEALAHRQPRYAAMAEHWGVTVTADQISGIRSEADFTDVIADALEARG
ncbi:ATPase [Phaeobacter sp. C3_T13_0]|uniref:ATPase n=1 Tax=Phaeobacter cretensis TaxID=3342641 RepID=UPI0039BC7345